MNVFDLEAVLRLNTDNFTSGLGSAAGAVGNFVSGVGRVSAAAIGSAVAGATAMTTAAVNSYGEYEQLWGGVQKLFGAAGMSLEQYAASVDSTTAEVEDQYNSLIAAQNIMAENAANAWQTSGMSANAYMETATSVAGTLIRSVGGDTEEAARLTDIMMQDISDNFNTFGGDIEAIRNAYMGFSRDNFMMLDNLKLGYAGTAAGMIELINDSGILEEEIDDINDVSFDQMIEAIHVVQENMQIAGTTAREAANTIQGSLGALRGAWNNLLTGLADPDADIGALVDNVVTAATNAFNNLLPAASQALEGIATLIDNIAPVIAEQLPELIDRVLPPLLNAAIAIVTALADALPDIMVTISNKLPEVINRIIPVIIELVPLFLSIGGEILGALITGIVDNADELVAGGLEVMQQLIDSFLAFTDGDGLETLLTTAMTILEMLANFLIDNIPALMGAATEIIVRLIEFIAQPDNQVKLIDLALQLITAIADGLVQAMPAIASLIPELLVMNAQAIIQAFPIILNAIGDLLGDLAMLVLGLIGGLMGMSYDEVVGTMQEIYDSASQSLSDAWNGLVTWVTNVGESVSGMWTDVTAFFTDGISGIGEALAGWWDELTQFGADLASAALGWASDMIDNFVNGISNGISAVGDAVSNIASTVSDFIGFSEPDYGPLSNFHTFAPDMIDLFSQGIDDSLPVLENSLNNMSQAVYDGMPSPELGDGNNGGLVNAWGGKNDNVRDNRPIVVQAYFGNEKFDEYVVDSNQRNDHISGGRA